MVATLKQKCKNLKKQWLLNEIRSYVLFCNLCCVSEIFADNKVSVYVTSLLDFKTRDRTHLIKLRLYIENGIIQGSK